LLLLLTGLIFCHGCHGEDDDDHDFGVLIVKLQND
jgi:hypothetical protein